jgi:hypothetical protein
MLSSITITFVIQMNHAPIEGAHVRTPGSLLKNIISRWLEILNYTRGTMKSVKPVD